jgi:hypothetical protein
MTEHTRLTLEELENVRQEVSDCADWLLSYPPRSDAHVAAEAMHAPLGHAAALEAENAALRKVAGAGDKLANVAEDIVLGISRYAIKPSDEPVSVGAAQIVTLKAAYEEFYQVLNGEDAANE